MLCKCDGHVASSRATAEKLENFVTLFSEASTHNNAHTTPFTMSSSAPIGVETRAGKRKRERREATAANAGEAILGLPNHLVVTHILRSEYFDDPADLARLPVVSSAMRDTVAAMGLRFEELGEFTAAKLGCLSAVQRLQRGGRLSRQEYLCFAAAMRGHLEVLKVLREYGCLWDENTCYVAARNGHFDVLQWARASGCPCGAKTCAFAAAGGHLEVLQWARENSCPWDKHTLIESRAEGHLELLNWAIANDCPEHDDD